MSTSAGSRDNVSNPRRKTAPGKAETALLEPFEGLAVGDVVVPATTDDCAAALDEIRVAGAVGFDTESKPVFKKGVSRPGPDLVQFATSERAFIFQLQRLECRPFVTEILLADDILKVGFDLQSDRGALHKFFGIEIKSVLDLCAVFRKRGYRNTTGVRAAVGMVLHRSFSKSKHVTTSDWSKLQLSPNQLVYAANDAYAALMVWEALGRPAIGKK
ncbi:MAG TPA: 3'-5' exonuclease [Candidatus Ozemobacteraceae bacterium]|nr:3'-5' exonuclease [Candidatus Ozemobacteraceae bacterium]